MSHGDTYEQAHQGAAGRPARTPMHPEGEEVSETDEARVRRYADALRKADDDTLVRTNFRELVATYDESTCAVIAVADEEQAALRAELDRAQEHLAYHLSDFRPNADLEATGDLAVDMAAYARRLRTRAEAAEAELADARERLRQAEERLAKRKEWLEILDRAAGFGSLADVAAHQRELGVEGDHETRLRQKRVDLLRDLIATAAAQEADSASWQAADD